MITVGRALLVLILLIAFGLAVAALEPPNSSVVPETTRDLMAPSARLYSIEAQASVNGWTAQRYRDAGDLRLLMNDLPGALAYWEAAYALEPGSVTLTRQLAEGYVQTGQWAEAIDLLDALLDLTPTFSWAHYQRGLLLAAYDPAAAIDSLRAAETNPAYSVSARLLLDVLEVRGEDSLIGMYVGQELLDQELYGYAEHAFRQAAAIGSPYPEALAYVALARDSQGKDGTEWIAQAIELAPDSPQVRFIFGLHLRWLGDYAASRDALLIAVALDPDNPAFYAELGEAYRLLRELGQAEYWLQVAIVLSNNDRRYQSLLAQFYANEAVNIPNGLDVLDEAVETFPESVDIIAARGWSIYQAGDMETGAAEIARALAIAPENARALYYQGRIALESGDLAAARLSLEAVAAGNSAFALEASRILEQLASQE